MMHEEPIGYLVYPPNAKGLAVVCPRCNNLGWHSHKPVFAINVLPYQQHCYNCKTAVVNGNPRWPELFDPEFVQS